MHTEASGQHSRRKRASVLAPHGALIVSVHKGTVVWMRDEAGSVSGQHQTRYFRKLFHIAGVSWTPQQGQT